MTCEACAHTTLSLKDSQRSLDVSRTLVRKLQHRGQYCPVLEEGLFYLRAPRLLGRTPFVPHDLVHPRVHPGGGPEAQEGDLIFPNVTQHWQLGWGWSPRLGASCYWDVTVLRVSWGEDVV